jgi:hypothetical protein
MIYLLRGINSGTTAAIYLDKKTRKNREISEDVMKNYIKLTAALTLAATYANAASGANSDNNSLLVNLFLAFAAIIIVFQLVPGVIVFGSMLKGIFSREVKTGSSAD